MLCIDRPRLIQEDLALTTFILGLLCRAIVPQHRMFMHSSIYLLR